MHIFRPIKILFSILLLFVFIFYASLNVYAKTSSSSHTKGESVGVNIPSELIEIFEIEFLGAFRVYTKEGQSNSNYAVGTLAFNPSRESLFLAGHDHHDAIAEFKIPKNLSYSKRVKDLPNAKLIQPYVKILDKKQIGTSTNKITGMLYYNGSLLVNSEVWYDASGKNQDNHLVIEQANNLKSSKYVGMLQLEGAAKSAGYMSYIPQHLHQKFGGQYLTGWATNYSITTRYSQGPSLYIFSPDDSLKASISSPTIETAVKMVYPFSEGKFMVENSYKYDRAISPKWGPMSSARYGFIIPNTNWFLAVGSHGGIEGGIGYKIKQDNGKVCGGKCTKKVNDVYNYFWLFNVDEILDAKQPHMIQPYTYGKWEHPYDKNGRHKVVGATFDHTSNRLFLSLYGAGRLGKYDRPPLIVTYRINAK